MHLRLLLALPEGDLSEFEWSTMLDSVTQSPYVLSRANNSEEILHHLGSQSIAYFPVIAQELSGGDPGDLVLNGVTIPWEKLLESVRTSPPRILILAVENAPPHVLVRKAAILSEHIPCILLAPDQPNDGFGPTGLSARRIIQDMLRHAWEPAVATANLTKDVPLELWPRCFGGGRPPSPKDPPAWLLDDNWRLALDRRQQSQLAFGAMAITMQRQSRNRGAGLVLLWYGLPGSGLERLHHRLRWELQKEGRGWYILEPGWPATRIYDDKDFSGGYEKALRVPADLVTDKNSLELKLEDQFPSLPSGASQVLYVDHGILPASFSHDKRFAPIIRDYIQWWAKTFVAAVPQRLTPVLAIALERPDDPEWITTLRNTLTDADTQAKLFPVRIEILTELPDIAVQDVIEFIYDYQLDVPVDRQRAVAEAIIAETNGRYEETLHHIEQLPWMWQYWWRKGAQ